MVHEVVAMRRGHDAYLECRVCRGSAQVAGDDFDGMNDFIARHRACPAEMPMDVGQ